MAGDPHTLCCDASVRKAVIPGSSAICLPACSAEWSTRECRTAQPAPCQAARDMGSSMCSVNSCCRLRLWFPSEQMQSTVSVQSCKGAKPGFGTHTIAWWACKYSWHAVCLRPWPVDLSLQTICPDTSFCLVHIKSFSLLLTASITCLLVISVLQHVVHCHNPFSSLF